MSGRETGTRAFVGLVLSPRDTVATLLEPVRKGQSVTLSDGRAVEARADADIYFKLAVEAVRRGDPVRKYGQAIGRATADIAAGEVVHLHNLVSDRARRPG